MHDQPVRSGRMRHSSSTRHGSILHHHFWRTMEAGGKNAAQQKAVSQTEELQITKGDGGESDVALILDRLCISGKIGYTLTSVDSKCILQRGKKRASTTIIPSTHEGRARVVPATCPGKQEHLTVWERSSILFLLQQRWAATTSQVPVRSGFDPERERERQRRWNGGNMMMMLCVLHVSWDSLSNSAAQQ